MTKRFRNFLPAIITYTAMMLVLRVMEIISTVYLHILPVDSANLFLYGFSVDLFFLAANGALFAVLYVIIAAWDSGYAAAIVYTVMICSLILHATLVAYFGYGLLPLGADLYGYSLSEIQETLLTSIGSGFVTGLIGLTLLLFSGVGIFIVLRRKQYSNRVMYGVAGWMLAGTIGGFIFRPVAADYDVESSYYLVVNKQQHFIRETIEYAQKKSTDSEVRSFRSENEFEYPFWRDASRDNGLDDYLKTGNRPPNIVFVIVEGLGASFSGPNSPYPGFTPHLDELAEKSLYWTHFLSTSGRSFAVQSSLLGSLPYGDHGFMDLGFQAPDHQSLISLLNQNGYHTGYYAGYDVSFDKLDVFLERQQIDLIMDQAFFDESYSRIEGNKDGFSWGYSDKSLFRKAFDFIDEVPANTPRLDIFFTVNLHEPFIVEDRERYLQEVRDIAGSEAMSKKAHQTIETYPDIFAALLYTDDAIRDLMKRYRERPGYENTIFIISGDHRIIPVSHRNRIDRYWVPFMIYSPLIENPEVFHSVSSHLNVTPTLLGHLSESYGLDFPSKVHWLGESIDMETKFRSVHDIPFIRNKNQMSDYLSGTQYLSDDRLYELSEGMKLVRSDNREALDVTRQTFNQFKRMNSYVTQNNKLMPAEEGKSVADEQKLVEEEDVYFNKNNLSDEESSELFELGRELIFDDRYDEGRLVLRRLLRNKPSHVDARLLYGRSFAWDGEYEKALEQYLLAKKRNPDYYDIYSALADLFYWQGKAEQTIRYVSEGLEHNSGHPELMFKLARAHYQQGDNSRAKEIADEALASGGENPELNTLIQRINSQ